jgi:hypothetical protein
MSLAVQYPDATPDVRLEDGAECIRCMIRKKWIRLTPEEWVRQNFLLYLTQTLQFPASLIAVEKQLVIADVKRRFDIVVYDRKARPYLLVECKEMEVTLEGDTFLQALHYYAALQTRYLVMTNGNTTYAFERVDGKFIPASSLEMYK